MKCEPRHHIHILLIFISLLGCNNLLLSQERFSFFTPEIDSICQNTLEYIHIKNSLLRQQYQIGQETQQLEQTINELTRHHSEILEEQKFIESELYAVNRYIDSLTPKRRNSPQPKENIINILNERISFHGSYGLNINQLALSNWAAGGENSATGKAFANLNLIYRNKTFEQKLIGDFAFGLSRFADKRIEKSDDKIDLTYALSLKSKSQWSLSTVATFNTQFADGYKYPNDSTVISTFFAPAYLTLSGGYTYKTKNERFQIFLSPFAGKATFVMNQDLADLGSFGVKKGYYDQDSVWIPGERFVASLGINMIVNYKQPIGKNITYTTLLSTYYNYTEVRDDNRLRLDFNWENSIHFVVSKYITTVLFVHMKYDHNTTFPIYETVDGEEVVIDNIPKLQFKESLGIAFIHNF